MRSNPWKNVGGPEKAVILIGGTFNPFTNAHKEMAAVVRDIFPDADIVYIPSNMDYIAKWKDLPGDEVFSGKNRVEVMTKAVKDIPNCFVSDIESSGRANGRTYITVQHFKQSYDKVYICIGSDKLYEIEKWYKAEQLMEEVKVLLFTRGESIKDCNSEFVKRYRSRFLEIEFNYPGVSSSLIRGLYEKGKIEEIKEYVPEPVYEYLRKAKEED